MRRKEGMPRKMMNPRDGLNPFRNKNKDKGKSRAIYKARGPAKLAKDDPEREERMVKESELGWSPKKKEGQDSKTFIANEENLDKLRKKGVAPKKMKAHEETDVEDDWEDKEEKDAPTYYYAGETEGMGSKRRGGGYSKRDYPSKQSREKSMPYREYREKRIKQRLKKKGKEAEKDILMDDERRSEITEKLETFEDIPSTDSDVVENKLTEEQILEEKYREDIKNTNQEQEGLDRSEYDIETIHPEDSRPSQEGSKKSFSVRSGVNTGEDRPAKSKRQPLEKNIVYRRKSKARRQEREFKKEQENANL